LEKLFDIVNWLDYGADVFHDEIRVRIEFVSLLLIKVIEFVKGKRIGLHIGRQAIGIHVFVRWKREIS
jgi:hypothetical protein